MKKLIVILGIVILILGLAFEFLAGATLPGGITIPLVYGSNQVIWLFVAIFGFIVGIVGLILKTKEKK